MANKTWDFTVVYQDPEDFELTPAKRREVSTKVAATTAKRAISKALKEICDEFEPPLPASDVVVLDCYRTAKYEEV